MCVENEKNNGITTLPSFRKRRKIREEGEREREKCERNEKLVFVHMVRLKCIFYSPNEADTPFFLFS